jgi:hypothetical protein
MASKSQLDKIRDMQDAGWKIVPAPERVPGAPVKMQDPAGAEWLVYVSGDIKESPFSSSNEERVV